MTEENTYNIISRYVDREITTHFPHEVYESLPPGWRKLMAIVDDVLYVCFSEYKISAINTTNGTLKFDVISLNNASVEYIDETLDMIKIYAARKSAITCMICGNKSERRKQEVGSPSLCWKHYTEYVNELPKQQEVLDVE